MCIRDSLLPVDNIKHWIWEICHWQHLLAGDNLKGLLWLKLATSSVCWQSKTLALRDLPLATSILKNCFGLNWQHLLSVGNLKFWLCEICCGLNWHHLLHVGNLKCWLWDICCGLNWHHLLSVDNLNLLSLRYLLWLELAISIQSYVYF